MLSAKNIEKKFYDPIEYKVLKDISLKVNEGELISIYGESGSGKSTLLYILATIDRIYTGDLNIAGTDISKLSDRELTAFRNRHIGFVYQSHYLLPEFNVLQNVMLPAFKLGVLTHKKIKEQSLSLLDEFGIQSLASRPVNKLSGGQQQRVAIARALINDPKLIIADEPTGNLDKKNSEITFELLKSAAELRGKSVIIATHNSSIQENSHRSVEMIDGQLRQHKYLNKSL